MLCGRNWFFVVACQKSDRSDRTEIIDVFFTINPTKKKKSLGSLWESRRQTTKAAVFHLNAFSDNWATWTHQPLSVQQETTTMMWNRGGWGRKGFGEHCTREIGTSVSQVFFPACFRCWIIFHEDLFFNNNTNRKNISHQRSSVLHTTPRKQAHVLNRDTSKAAHTLCHCTKSPFSDKNYKTEKWQ